MDWSHIIENFVLLNNLYFSTTPPPKKIHRLFVFLFLFFLKLVTGLLLCLKTIVLIVYERIDWGGEKPAQRPHGKARAE